MKMILLSVYDRKAQLHTHLIPTTNIAVAIRDLTELINTDDKSPWHKWPGDYSLHEVGAWSQETGFPTQRVAPPEEDDPGTPRTKHLVDFDSLKRA